MWSIRPPVVHFFLVGKLKLSPKIGFYGGGCIDLLAGNKVMEGRGALLSLRLHDGIYYGFGHFKAQNAGISSNFATLTTLRILSRTTTTSAVIAIMNCLDS